jgi:hypothetical protein
MNPYEKLLWRESENGHQYRQLPVLCKEGAEETVHRALALRHMELPVGDFIRDALAKMFQNFGTGVTPIQRHRRRKPRPGFGYIANAYGVDQQAEKEALGYREAWIAHPDHTITKQWLPSVQFSSFFYHSSALMVTLECEQ